jgi:hypothetical protein
LLYGGAGGLQVPPSYAAGTAKPDSNSVPMFAAWLRRR